MNLKARKLWTSIGLLILCLSASAGTSKQNDESLLKPRIVVLTDIAPADVEPDDMESMVRLLAHADMFEIEGLVATGGWNICGGTYPESWMDSVGAGRFFTGKAGERKAGIGLLAHCRLSAQSDGVGKQRAGNRTDW